MRSQVRILITWWIIAMTSYLQLIEAGDKCIPYPSYCNNEATGFDQSCGFDSSSVNCQYTPVEVETAVYTEPMPGLVDILTPRVYPMDRNYVGTCPERAVNITWKLTQNASSQSLRGFELTMSHQVKLYDETDNTQSSHDISSIQESETRVFNISLESHDSTAITFYYDCLTVKHSTTYTITLKSLMDSQSRYEVVSEIRFITDDKFNNSYRVPEPANSALWIPISWAFYPLDSGSIVVCFALAPASYSFTSYRIELVGASSGDLSIFRYEETYSVFTSGEGNICRTFEDVCPAVYKSYVYAVNDRGGCKCKEEGRCARYGCAWSQITRLDMTSGKQCSNIPHFFTQTPEGTTPGEIGKLVAAEVGAGLALTLIAVLIVILYRKNRTKKNYGGSNSPTDSGDKNKTSDIIERRPPILIVYSRDNETHRQVVCRFAAFLQAHCFCDVIIDEWPDSREAISQLGRAQWLHQQIDKVSHILLVHSAGARKRFDARLMRIRYECINDVMLDLFIPSVTLLQEYFLHSTANKKLFEVYFPYTSHEDVIDLKLGGGLVGRSGKNSYCLMSKVDELFLNIHRLTKYDAKGKANMKLINVEEYDTCSEGQLLKEAIAEAVVYHRHHKNLFEEWQEISDDNFLPYSRPGESEMLLDELYPPSMSESVLSVPNSSSRQKAFPDGNNNSDDFVTIRIRLDIEREQLENSMSRAARMDDGKIHNTENPGDNNPGNSSEQHFDSGLETLRCDSPDKFYFPCRSIFMNQLDSQKMNRCSSISSSDSNFTCIAPDEIDDGSSLHSSQCRKFAQDLNDSVSEFSQASSYGKDRYSVLRTSADKLETGSNELSGDIGSKYNNDLALRLRSNDDFTVSLRQIDLL